MRKSLIIVATEELAEEPSVILEGLINKPEFEVFRWSFKEYAEMVASSNFESMYPNAKFVFLCCKSPEGTVKLLFTRWRYERFGCCINWKGNKCVLFVQASDLPYSEYDEFRDYCEVMSFTYPDVIIPPESPWKEGFEAFKMWFGDKETNSVQRAQLSVITHEFVNRLLDDFLAAPHDVSDAERDHDNLEMLHKMESNANKVVTTAVTASVAVVAVPIPVADAGMLIGAQTVMMTAIASIFKITIDKSIMKALIYATLSMSGATIIGKIVASWLLKLIPGFGWAVGGAIKATVAALLTYAIGSAFVAVCKDIKLGKLKEADLASAAGKDVFKDYFKYYAAKWSKKAKTAPDNVESIISELVVTNDDNINSDLTSGEWLDEFKNTLNSKK
jgi:uncharacterized protein (DUF697 family)